jgi:hypothetical protein
MRQFGLILVGAYLVASSAASAGELDAEYRGKTLTVVATTAPSKTASELDSESPTQTCCFKRWLFRCSYGYGYGGYGYGGFAGYGGYGGYGGGYGGFGGGYGGYGGFGGGYGGFGGGYGGMGYGGMGGYGGMY